MEHRAPWRCTYAKEDKNKCKPGVPPKSNQEYFEILSLCALQAGLSWSMVRKNWAKFKHGFYDFNITKLSRMRANELHGAIPSINPRAVFQVRTGVMRDLVKRAKEFGSEFRLSAKAFPGAKFIAVFKIPPHELNRRTEIRQKILEHRVGREYDVIFQDELEEVLKKFKKWNIPKGKPKPLVLLGVERKSVS